MPRDALAMTLCMALCTAPGVALAASPAMAVPSGATAAVAGVMLAANTSPPAAPAAPTAPAPSAQAPTAQKPAATPAKPGAAAPAKPEVAAHEHRDPAKPVMKMIPAGETMPILGHDVDGPDGQNIGKLVDVLVDAGGVPRAAVLDVGGFLGVGNRVVSVEWDALHFHLRSADHAIVTTLTPDQIRAAPEYKDPGQAAPVVVAPRHR